jgi:hypothetical protein
MKYICLGYIEPGKFENIEGERAATAKGYVAMRAASRERMGRRGGETCHFSAI